MKIIILNGPMGVGKTTIGTHIADKYPGTAFIDGDWCMDLHPFVGNREMKAMAVDNILHMIGNYAKCPVCRMIVLVWLMDDESVYRTIMRGVSETGLEAKSVTLVCGERELEERWRNDKACEWRTDEWLAVSKASLPYFSSLENVIDTSGLTVEQTAELIMGM